MFAHTAAMCIHARSALPFHPALQTSWSNLCASLGALLMITTVQLPSVGQRAKTNSAAATYQCATSALSSINQCRNKPTCLTVAANHLMQTLCAHALRPWLGLFNSRLDRSPRHESLLLPMWAQHLRIFAPLKSSTLQTSNFSFF